MSHQTENGHVSNKGILKEFKSAGYIYHHGKIDYGFPYFQQPIPTRDCKTRPQIKKILPARTLVFTSLKHICKL
ncbi:hypothetical protein COO20_00440 [Thalassospira marina]|uniref:Uncharacterized protein n=1 Tax=Thalassospira marina TaxID=2048283 RepID=A0A2N3KYS9_9PROT|nr:hypothetical protein COO20_00440 [Thalassospira marina]